MRPAQNLRFWLFVCVLAAAFPLLVATDARSAEEPQAAGRGPVGPGEWVNLFDWAEEYHRENPDADTVLPNIEARPSAKEGVTLRPAAFGRYPLPVVVEGNYELEVELTRHEGSDGVGLLFPVGLHTLLLVVDAQGAKSGVGWIDGKGFASNETSRPSPPVANGSRRRLRIEVRDDGTTASFHVDLDGVKDFIAWSGRPSRLTNADKTDWRTGTACAVRLVASSNRVTFHSARLRMASGTVRRNFITAADLEEDMVRLVGETPLAATVGMQRPQVNRVAHDRSAPPPEELWPLIARDFEFCGDYYGAHAPSLLKCPIPAGAKSFSVVGYNASSRTTEFRISADGAALAASGAAGVCPLKTDLPPGAKTLELRVDPLGPRDRDQSYWCVPRFHDRPADRIADDRLDGPEGPLKFVVAASEIPMIPMTRNRPIPGTASVPISFRDVRPCHEFVYAAAPSSVTYLVPEGMRRFSAVGYCTYSQHVRYEVWADGSRLYASLPAGVVRIDVPLPEGAKSITIKVDDLGDASYDHSIWCYPRLHRK